LAHITFLATLQTARLDVICAKIDDIVEDKRRTDHIRAVF